MTKSENRPMTDDQIKQMVDRFLSWKLPEDFRPDAGISFKAEFNENTPFPMKHAPSGTNLFDARQAEAMVRYMLEGINTPAITVETQSDGAAVALRHAGEALASVGRSGKWARITIESVGGRTTTAIDIKSLPPGAVRPA